MYLMESDEEGERVELKTDRGLTEEQLRFATIRAGDCVVDIGCAAGTTTRIISDLVGATGTAVGVDASSARILEARSQTARAANISYRIGSAQALPAACNEFDVAWCRFLLEYLPDRDAVVAEMIRVVRPGGTICIADLDGNGIWTDPLEPWLERERDAAVATLATTGFDPRIGRKLYSIAAAAGLNDVRMDIRPYNVLAGPVRVQSALDRWERKHRSIERALCSLGWPSARAAAIVDGMRQRLRTAGSFSYSVLFTVVGRVPDKERLNATR